MGGGGGLQGVAWDNATACPSFPRIQTPLKDHGTSFILSLQVVDLLFAVITSVGQKSITVSDVIF